MEGDKAAKRVRAREATSWTNLPSTALDAILEATMNGKDVAGLLTALPASTLPPKLVALRDLGAAVNLAQHWPFVQVTDIPIEHAHLAIAALPTFQGAYVDAGFTALTWLDATLPPAMPVALVVDPSVPGLLGAFALVWGDRITHITIKGHEVNPDPIPDLLGRCISSQSVTIQSSKKSTTTPVAAASYLAVLRTTQLAMLDVTVAAPDALDVTAVVAWLQGSSAESFSLSCTSVSDPTALASAIQDCSTLSSLSLNNVMDVQAALMSSAKDLHHTKALSLSQSAAQYGIPTHVLLGKLDRTKVVSLSVRNNNHQALPLGDVVSVFGMCPSLESVTLDNWALQAVSTTGACPSLTSVALRRLQFDVVGDVARIILLLSTSQCLLSVDLSGTKLGSEGVLALAHVLPIWMTRGLETLRLDDTGLGDADAGVLALALATKCHRRHLTMHVTGNPVTMASASVLLTALGASRNVTLRMGGPFVHSDVPSKSRWPHERSQEVKTLKKLVRAHKLRYTGAINPTCGEYTSPSL